MKKKILSIGLVLILVFVMLGCAKKADNQNADNPGDQTTPTIVTTWAGYTEDRSMWKVSLNKDRKLINDKSFPIYRFDSASYLDKFKSEHDGIYDYDSGYQEAPSFNETAKKYNDDFFSAHSILLIYMSSSMPNLRYAVKDIQYNDSKLLVNVVQTNYPENLGDGYVGWFFIIEINKTDYQDCSSYDALSPYLL